MAFMCPALNRQPPHTMVEYFKTGVWAEEEACRIEAHIVRAQVCDFNQTYFQNLKTLLFSWIIILSKRACFNEKPKQLNSTKKKKHTYTCTKFKTNYTCNVYSFVNERNADNKVLSRHFFVSRQRFCQGFFCEVRVDLS